MMTYQELTTVLVKCGATCKGNLCPSARLLEDLQLTSFGMMLLLMELESKLNQPLSPTDFLPVRTVADLCGVLGVPYTME